MTVARGLFPLVLSLAVVPLQAQQPDVQLGVAAGAAVTTLIGDVTDAENRTSAFFGGSFVWRPAGSSIGLETGLLYVPKGARSTVEGVDAEGVLKLNYLEVPLLLNVALAAEGANVRPVLTAGGSLGFKTACKFRFESPDLSMETDCDEESEARVKSLDIGLSAGLGLEIAAGARGVIAPFVRYTRGLTEIADSNTDEDGAKNSAFLFGAALRIRM